DLAALTHQLALISRQTGHPREAVEYYRLALNVFRQAYGPEDDRVAVCLKNLGYAYLDLQEEAQARAHFDKALAIRIAAHGAEHPAVANSLLDVALVCGRQGEHGTALFCLHQAVTLYRRYYGPRHATVVRALHDLGHLYLLQRDPNRALQQ